MRTVSNAGTCNITLIMQDSRVIELGCGVGFLGLHLLKSIALTALTLTDCHPEVLKAVNFNVKINFGDISKVDSKENMIQLGKNGPPNETKAFPWVHSISTDCTVVVDKLDWTHDKGSIYDVDWILGADIVYERTLIPSLCQVLQRILRSNPKATALISCTERSSTTLACFEKELTERQMQFRVISRGSFTPAESLLCSDVSHQKTRIYEIKLHH